MHEHLVEEEEPDCVHKLALAVGEDSRGGSLAKESLVFVLKIVGELKFIVNIQTQTWSSIAAYSRDVRNVMRGKTSWMGAGVLRLVAEKHVDRPQRCVAKRCEVSGV